MLPDYYQTLGVGRNASLAEIKKAYRQLALRYHPDRNKASDAHQTFIEINEAYLILADDEARAKYDSAFGAFSGGTSSYPSETSADYSTVESWARKARSQSESYAQMSFKDFSKFVSGVVREVGFQGKQIIFYAISGVFFTSGLLSLIFGANVLLSIVSIGIGTLGIKYTVDRWEAH